MKNQGAPRGRLALWRFRSAERRWRASLLRSTATEQGGVRRQLDSRDTLLEQRTTKQENKGHRVTPLLAQRITLPGNSYFWRTAVNDFSDFGLRTSFGLRISAFGFQNSWLGPS